MAAMSYDAVHSDPTESNDELRTDAGPRQLSEVRIRYLRDEYGGSEQSVLAPAAEELRPHHRCCALILLLAICAAVGYWWLVQVYWWLVLPPTARGLVSNMTFEEKASLVRGVGWSEWSFEEGYYVGSVPAVPRLRIPSINMHDGPQGFRTTDRRIVGSVTSWPCLSHPSAPADEGAPRLHERASRLDVGCTVCSPQLAVGATWNVALAHSYGAALGAEFRAKGANVILGPGVNLARVALNGRAAEYISGEEPALGAAMGSAYVRGVQSQGVAAVVKHFAVNNQETLRTETDVIVSERALWEVYYAAFEACVEAGVASVMCSYNKINGEHACGSPRLLARDLKRTMRFAGWVMSDWWAVRSASAVPCTVGCDCAAKLYATDATSAEHTALSRRVAAASIVLLKNEPPYAAGSGSGVAGTLAVR
eukprot:jgi/Chrpa1/21072/Chrysochromulina_OHIO_Genome00000625-RA